MAFDPGGDLAVCANCIRGQLPLPLSKRKLPVPQKAQDSLPTREQRPRDVRRGARIAGRVFDCKHHRRQQRQSENDAATVDHQAACPFTQVISLRLEHEPLVAEKRYGDVEQAG